MTIYIIIGLFILGVILYGVIMHELQRIEGNTPANVVYPTISSSNTNMNYAPFILLGLGIVGYTAYKKGYISR